MLQVGAVGGHSTAEQIFFGSFGFIGNFMIVYLFCSCLVEKSLFGSCKQRFVPRLNCRIELEEMAPMIAIYHETSPSIASSHEEESHLSILTTPRLLPHVRLVDHRF